MVAEVGVYLNVLNAVQDGAVIDQGGPEGEGVEYALIDQCLGGGSGFIVDFHGAIGIEGKPLTGGAAGSLPLPETGLLLVGSGVLRNLG